MTSRLSSWLARLCRVLLSAIFLCTLLSQLAHAGQDSPPPAEDRFPIFWRIEKPGVAPSWLLGTMHVHDLRTWALLAQVRPFIQQSDHVYTEVRIDDATVKTIRATLFAPAKTPVANELDSAYLNKLKEQLTLRQIDPQLTQTMASWAATISMTYAPDFRPTPIIDMQVGTEALTQKKEYAGLETVASGFAAFQSIPEPRQILWLKDLLDHPMTLAEQQRMVDQYFHNALPADFLKNATDRPTSLSAQDHAWFLDLYERVFVEQRTAGFYHGLEAPLNHGHCFVAVGVGHLVGDHGLVAILRQAGYQVTPQALN